MPSLHLYSSQRLSDSMVNSLTNLQSWLKSSRMNWSFSFGKTFILFCISLNSAIADQIFTTDFESGSLDIGQKQQGGFFWRVGKHASVTSENPKNGSYSLKIAYPVKNDNGYSHAEQPFHIGGNYPDLWVKYDLFVPANYEHLSGKATDNNKGFIHLWAASYDGGSREGPLLGPNFWPTSSGSKIIMWGGARINGTITMDKHWYKDTSGKHDAAITENDKGSWMTIVIHAKYASISNDDGVYEVWKTDKQGKTIKLINIHNGPWYATKPNSNEPARGFDEGYLLGWANGGFSKGATFYIDNFKMSTSPLINALASPKPPINFTSQ